jgi:hypothetical protein
MTITTESCAVSLTGEDCIQTCVPVTGCIGGWQWVDTTTISATKGCLSVVPSASAEAVNFETVVWDGTGYPDVSRNMTISITGPEGCITMGDNWVVQMSSSNLTGPGGASIPASAIAHVGSSSIPTGMSSSPAGFLADGSVIATGSSSVVKGSDLTIEITLTPPDNAPPGIYTGTFTVTTGPAGN